jgi:hypothetical protein
MLFAESNPAWWDVCATTLHVSTVGASREMRARPKTLGSVPEGYSLLVEKPFFKPILQRQLITDPSHRRFKNKYVALPYLSVNVASPMLGQVIAQ